MNDVMTDNHRCPHTGYPISQILSTPTFVEIAHFHKASPHFILAILIKECYTVDKGREPGPGSRSTGKELTL